MPKKNDLPSLTGEEDKKDNKFKSVNYQEINEALSKNLELNKKMYSKISKIENYVFWQKIFARVKFIVIVLPIIIAVFLLPALLKDFSKKYKNFLDFTKNGVNINLNINSQSLPISQEVLQKILQEKSK